MCFGDALFKMQINKKTLHSDTFRPFYKKKIKFASNECLSADMSNAKLGLINEKLNTPNRQNRKQSGRTVNVRKAKIQMPYGNPSGLINGCLFIFLHKL